ncbi:hypothetical protein V8G54_037655 [Vigna mungo]|uniref:Uncharacterized protein n=1 Tax=Vigna mungo TaxID=3915 RepID=A0AAQ3RFK5_VIGMU
MHLCIRRYYSYERKALVLVLEAQERGREAFNAKSIDHEKERGILGTARGRRESEAQSKARERSFNTFWERRRRGHETEENHEQQAGLGDPPLDEVIEKLNREKAKADDADIEEIDHNDKTEL